MRYAKEHGQALVEFAIVIPVFVLILAGVIQFGMILWGQNTLNQVVRDAGRYAATLPDCSASDATGRIEALANAAAGPWTLTDHTATYSDKPPKCPPADNNKQVWVTVAASADVIRFFPWLPGDGKISSSVDFRVELAP